jgi:hypothetical protein
VRCRPLDQLEITKASNVDREVLQRLGRLVDNQDVCVVSLQCGTPILTEHNVKLLNRHDGLRIDGI